IENYLTAKSHSYSNTPSVYRVFVKNTVSGHGADNSNCSEFCNKYYQLKIDNSQVSQKQLWRGDCGYNDVYSQTGTWIYNRSNWCPGNVVDPIYHDITYWTLAETNFSVNIDMQPYSSSNPSGGYFFHTQLITYGIENHTKDVSLEDIISPSKNEN